MLDNAEKGKVKLQKRGELLRLVTLHLSSAVNYFLSNRGLDFLSKMNLCLCIIVFVAVSAVKDIVKRCNV